MTPTNGLRFWWISAILCVLCFVGGLGAAQLLHRKPVSPACPTPLLARSPECPPASPCPACKACPPTPVLPAPVEAESSRTPTTEQLQHALAQVEKILSSVRKDQETLQKKWLEPTALFPAQAASVEKMKKDLMFVQNKIEETKLLDDPATISKKALYKRNPNSILFTAEMGGTPFGRLSLAVEEVREPLARLALAVPKSLEAGAQCTTRTQATTALLTHQKEQLDALQKTLRQVKDFSSSL